MTTPKSLRILSLIIAIALLAIGVAMWLGFADFSQKVNDSSNSNAGAIGVVVLAILFIPFVALYLVLSVVSIVLTAIQIAKKIDGLSIANLIFRLLFVAFFVALCIIILAPPTYLTAYTAMFFIGFAISAAAVVLDIKLLACRRRARQQ